LSFFAVDIDRLLRDRPDFAGSLFGELMQHIEEGTFQPLPHRVFPISQVQDAFRYMAQAKHIGKIVMSLQDADVMVAPAIEEKLTLRPDGTYLIAGGLGGFSLMVAQWLVECGAKHLVLMGRSGASSPAAKEAVKTLESAGASVVVAKADVTQAHQVADVLALVDRSMPPLRGLVHTAVVYEDAVLQQLDRERFFKVMAPKALGAWNLHALSLNAPLDFFINFSSITSTVGNPGQGNYVAANAFLDALAHHRRAQGLPCLTVNWGAIADAGYVAQNAEVGEHLERIGLKPLPSGQALRVLGELLQVEAVQTTVAPMDWQRWCPVHPAGASPRLSHLVDSFAVSKEAGDAPAGSRPKGDRTNEEDSLQNLLLAASPTERQQLLESRLREQVARVLGTSPAKLDSSKSLTNLGLDSLMAVELSNRINNLQLGVTIGSMKLLEGHSITQLATILLTAMGAATETLTDAIEQVDSETAAQLLAELEQLSEEEVEAILASEKLSV